MLLISSLGGHFSCNNSIFGSWNLAGDKICISGMIYFLFYFHCPLLEIRVLPVEKTFENYPQI
jgi:hypothetical protein